MFKKLTFLILLTFSHDTVLSTPLLIGIVGGSGSGKTTLAHNIAEIHKGTVTIISQDSYYKDLSHLPLKEREKTNFDAPDSIDFKAMLQDIKDLKAGKTIQKPLYDFSTHTRKKQGETLSPTNIIIIEGILLFTHKELRDLLDIKIFVDASPEERLLRRIDRDIKERGRTFHSVQKQYLETVAPMYEEYVLPTKKYANIIVPNGRGNTNKVALEMLISKTRDSLNENRF
ncbi:MAG: uridine kinase [Alphaproteobacteria bacterium]|nr:uridine kinase [Alphaproteobacteria bacterium]NCQ67265.1 uridine kinase [Alphaproteobacteria bacterium]NCT06768.1 uridine kinase [Alphaproteobacteria bacterium]